MEKIMVKIMEELIEELAKMTVPDLEEVRTTWISSLKDKKLSGCTIKLCEGTLEAIIKQKREREGAEA